jgi:hypothetical protein
MLLTIMTQLCIIVLRVKYTISGGGDENSIIFILNIAKKNFG